VTRRRSLRTKTRILSAFVLSLATLTVLIAFASPAQRAGTGQPSAHISTTSMQATTPTEAPRRQLLGDGNPQQTSQSKKTKITAQDPGNVSFLPAVTYLTGFSYPYSLAVADVNGDGNLDVLVVDGDGGAAGYVGVLLGNGDGTFGSAALYYAGGNQTASIAVADVNGDGKLDLVVTNTNGSNTIGVLLGNGDGTFQPAVTYSSGGGTPWSVAVADVNGDGKPDVLVANECAANSCSEGSVGVLLGNGDGTFRPAVMYSSGGPNFFNPVSIAVADLNGDGKLDLVVTNACGTSSDCSENGSVGVLLGNGDGTFNPAVTFGSGGQGTDSVTVADLNGDGKPDLVVANLCSSGGGTCSYSEPGDVGVLMGNGDGTFQPVLVYSSGGFGVESATVKDVNGDGKPDIIAANLCSSSGSSCPYSEMGNIGVLLGNGDGTFEPVLAYGSGGIGADFIVAADLNRDGKADLIVVDLGGEVGVLLNNTVFTQSTTTTLASSLNPSVHGQPITFTATVTTSGPIAPTGILNFKWGPDGMGTGTLNASGVAAFTTSILKAGPYKITAVYKGDASNLASTSAVLHQGVKH
jgi:hypothetical protein